MLSELETFFQRVPRASPIGMPNWEKYLDLLDAGTYKLNDRNDRFTNDPIPSAGIDFINSLIVQADIPHLLKVDNDVDLLRQVYREYQSPAYSDYIRQNPLKEKFFVSGEMSSVPEIVMVTEDFHIGDNLPLGEPDYAEWARVVKPLRALDLDSDEVQLDVVTSRLKYRYLPPRKAVFSLNIIKLLVLYIKHRRAHPEAYLERTNNLPFIYQTCIAPLLYDNLRTYILNIVHATLLGKTIDINYEFDEDEILHGNFSQFITANRSSAMRELNELLDKCARGRVKPDEVLITLKVDRETSLYDYMIWLVESHFVGHSGRQFEWVEFLRDNTALSILLRLFGLHQDSRRTDDLYKRFSRTGVRAESRRFWSHARPRFLSQYVKDRFLELSSLGE